MSNERPIDIGGARALRRLGTTGLLADLARARRTDPSTSHAAAEQVRRTGALRESQIIVRDAVARWPGRTAVELGRLLDGTPCREVPREDHWWRIEASRRLPELDPVHVRRGEPRTCSINGNSMATWWPT
jgi:hypothetical protein